MCVMSTQVRPTSDFNVPSTVSSVMNLHFQLVRRSFMVLARLTLLALLTACMGDRDLDSQLVLAARKGDVEKVFELIKAGAQVNGREASDTGETPILAAATAGRLRVVEILIERGANVNLASKAGATPLRTAAYAGYSDVVRLLLRAGAKPNAKDGMGWTPLLHASRNGHADVVKLLLEAGADARITDPDGRTPIAMASAGGFSRVVTLLEQALKPK